MRMWIAVHGPAAYQPIGCESCRITALQEFAAAVQSKEAYAEEVRLQFGFPTVP